MGFLATWVLLQEKSEAAVALNTTSFLPAASAAPSYAALHSIFLLGHHLLIHQGLDTHICALVGLRVKGLLLPGQTLSSG